MLALPVCVCVGGDYDVAPLIRIYNLIAEIKASATYLIHRFMIFLFVSLPPLSLR